MNANSTPGTPGQGEATGHSGEPGARPPQNFFDWIRSQGIARGQDRWIGGVASGVAHRFGVDPLIVRGIFVVLAIFAGVGVLLYGVAWALLPEPDGRIHAQEAGAGRWTAGMTGALITTIIGLPGLGRGVWGWGWDGAPGLFWTLFWVGAVACLVYFLVQRNRNRNGIPTVGAPYAGAPYYAGPEPGAPQGGTVPAAPDMHGGANAFAAPATSNLPIPGEAPPSGIPAGPGYAGPGYPGAPTPPQTPTPPQWKGGQPRGPRRQGPGAAIIAITAGAALLVGGTIKLLDAGGTIQLGDAANAVVWASGAAVLGLGILVAGLRGRTSGFLGFLAVVALVIGAIFNLVPRGDRFPMENTQWIPLTQADAREGYNITGANGTVDLTRLELDEPLESGLVVPLDITASNIKVIIPDTVPVELKADMTFANLKGAGGSTGNAQDDELRYFNTGKPGASLIIELDGTFSNVTIQEGN
ncbi:PspC domain-containing protein [Arthrobacter cupressi]